MTDIFRKIEGLAGLALLGGLAFAALKFGPGIVAAFRDAIDGLKQAGETVGGAVSSVTSDLDASPIVLGESVPEVITIINTPGATPADAALAGSTAIALDILGFLVPQLGPVIGIGKSATGAATGAAAGAAAGAPATGTAPATAGAPATADAAFKAASASAVSFLKGQAADRNFDANLAKKQAEWQAALDARTAAVKLLVQERNTALANEREAQRIKNERQYNAWLQSTRPASSVSGFLNVGKQYQGQQEIAPGVYVAPSGAYQIIQDGQIVAGGSAGAVQAALDKANTAMYPGTNYRREVVEAYQAKARAGDAAAAAWLKRFAPAGAV